MIFAELLHHVGNVAAVDRNIPSIRHEHDVKCTALKMFGGCGGLNTLQPRTLRIVVLGTKFRLSFFQTLGIHCRGVVCGKTG